MRAKRINKQIIPWIIAVSPHAQEANDIDNSRSTDDPTLFNQISSNFISHSHTDTDVRTPVTSYPCHEQYVTHQGKLGPQVIQTMKPLKAGLVFPFSVYFSHIYIALSYNWWIKKETKEMSFASSLRRLLPATNLQKNFYLHNLDPSSITW